MQTEKRYDKNNFNRFTVQDFIKSDNNNSTYAILLDSITNYITNNSKTPFKTLGLYIKLYTNPSEFKDDNLADIAKKYHMSNKTLSKLLEDLENLKLISIYTNKYGKKLFKLIIPDNLTDEFDNIQFEENINDTKVKTYNLSYKSNEIICKSNDLQKSPEINQEKEKKAVLKESNKKDINNNNKQQSTTSTNSSTSIENKNVVVGSFYTVYDKDKAIQVDNKYIDNYINWNNSQPNMNIIYVPSAFKKAISKNKVYVTHYQAYLKSIGKDEITQKAKQKKEHDRQKILDLFYSLSKEEVLNRIQNLKQYYSWNFDGLTVDCAYRQVEDDLTTMPEYWGVMRKVVCSY